MQAGNVAWSLVLYTSTLGENHSLQVSELFYPRKESRYPQPEKKCNRLKTLNLLQAEPLILSLPAHVTNTVIELSGLIR